MSSTPGGPDAFATPAAPDNPRWVVPTDCPECGAPVDQAVQSHAVDPICAYCHKPLPSRPFAAPPQPNVFQPFHPMPPPGQFATGQFGGPAGSNRRRYPFPVPRRRSHWLAALVTLAVIGVAVAIPLSKLVKHLPTTVNLKLGQQASLSSSDDNGITRITAEKVIFPLTKLSQGFFTPSPGKKYAAVEVRECGGPNYKTDNEGFGLSTSDWSLDGPGATAGWDPITEKNPALDKVHVSNLANKCATGWLTFEFPQDKVPSWVRYTGQFGSTFSWAIPRSRQKG